MRAASGTETTLIHEGHHVAVVSTPWTRPKVSTAPATPDGLCNGEVPLLAQIVGVVDVFDALTTERPYRGARPAEEAFQLLADESSKGWRDRALVDTFVNLIVASPA